MARKNLWPILNVENPLEKYKANLEPKLLTQELSMINEVNSSYLAKKTHNT